MTLILIVLALMGSSQLQYKVLIDLSDQTLLNYIVRRIGCHNAVNLWKMSRNSQFPDAMCGSRSKSFVHERDCS
jgi:hypothetical protein